MELTARQVQNSDNSNQGVAAPRWAGLLAMGGLWLSNHRCCKEERLPYPASSVLGVSFPILLFVGLLAEWWVAASQLSATSTSVTSHVTIHKRKAS